MPASAGCGGEKKTVASLAQTDSRYNPQISTSLRGVCSFLSGCGLRESCRLPMEDSKRHEAGGSDTHDAAPSEGLVLSLGFFEKA
jgi:hypothetical protein